MTAVLRVAIVGATGYAGAELLRLLLGHPDVEVTHLTSETFSGQSAAGVFPALRGRLNLRLEAFETKAVAQAADFIFTALPPQKAMAVIPNFLKAGRRVVDLSADYRLKDPAVYAEWYGAKHTSADLLAEAVYGLPEFYREDIRKARLVANPGCYPTGGILALGPLLEARLLDPSSLVVDAKSGVSGAGRRVELPYQFSEVNESLRAYGLPRHRHTPEMEQELGRLAGDPLSLTFTPHLVPMTRGVLTTCYGQGTRSLDGKEVRGVLEAAYQEEPFVCLSPEGEYPTTGQVWGSNHVGLAVQVDTRTNRVIVISVLDNLVKGAAGAAIQNMNLMAGFPETRGLEGLGIPV